MASSATSPLVVGAMWTRRNSPSPARLEPPDDLFVDLVAVAGQQPLRFVAGGAADVLLQLEPVAVVVDVQVRGLLHQPVQRVGHERRRPLAGEDRARA